MSNNKAKNETEKSEKNEEKIYHGIKFKACFACGVKIKQSTKICPYCKTKQDEKIIVP